ncbi:phBC6A51 family helix-turn-helix protein [Rummeliibacillus sp. NPDC094406]|uniref:phBC6A51 family helix-turn-helix protein n=1 Tax=Rummeliibacillus sp. NPDC094406 TaxID=3364511 RepID=UPI00381DEBF8
MTKQLNEKQIAAITYLATPKRGGFTYEQIADHVGVDVRTLHRWRRNDTFNKELKRVIVSNTVDRLPEVMEAIPDIIIRDGNAAMLRTFLQAHGLLADKVEVESKTDASGIDIEAIRERLKQR